MNHLRTCAIVLAVSVLSPSSAGAETDARDYEAPIYLPSGSTIALAYFRHISTSDTQDLTENLTLFRAVHVLKFDHLIVVPFDMYLPIVDVTLFAPTPEPGLTTTVHSSGIGDLTYLPSIGYYVDEDKQGTHTYVGFTPYITAPVGSYESTRIINIGGNRWTFQPQIAVGQRFLKMFTAEVVANVLISGTNDKLLVPGVPPDLGFQSLQQDAIWGAELHVAADLSPNFYTSLDYYYKASGRAHFDLALPTGTMDTTYSGAFHLHSLRYTFGVRIEKTSLLLLQFQEDLAATDRASLSRYVGVRFSHAIL